MADIVPIAVIGMSCRLPGGANSPEELWAMLDEGRSAWGPVPSNRWNAESFYHPDPRAKESLVFRSGFFLDQDIAAFDARFWSIPPREANGMDPQQRILLESTYEALENAGIPLETLKGSDTAVYVAEFPRDYDRMAYKDLPQLHRLHVTGKGDALLSNRLSYILDLKGPSLTIDTGCSGSLVALHQACQSIRTGESKIAIVGGSQLILHPDQSLTMNQIGMMNADGKCHVFDERGNGYARGEGTSTVILKRLDHALRDNDSIHGVIVHSGVNQDGKTQGIQFPSVDSQAALAKSVYRAAGIDPGKTVYVEAHGTGTQAGDAAEMSSIHQVFCENVQRQNPLVVGSVKANIGHLESTSGLAGFVKAMLILKNGQVPQVPELQTPKPSLHLDSRPITIPKKTVSLVPDNHSGPVRVSVNGFGYGGTNAHLILEPPPLSHLKEDINGSQPQPSVIRTGEAMGGSLPKLFVLSAASESSIVTAAEDLRRWIERAKPDSGRLRDLSYTLLTRRTHHNHRVAIVASDATELIEQLGRVNSSKTKISANVEATFVFTGQGAQWYAMGRELLSFSKIFGESIIKSTALLDAWGLQWKLMDELVRDESATQLNISELAQPATTALQIALVDMLADCGIKPQRVCGHSSGEIAAAYAAGALTHESALKISYFRGVCSSLAKKTNSSSGSMLAVGLGEDQVLPHVKRVKSGRLTVACINSPESTTISGDAAAIDELRATLESLSVFNRKLQVDTAYHSHHMMTVADDYMLSLKDIEYAEPRADVTFYSTVSGEKKTSDFGPSYWTQNVVSPVQFEKALGNVAAAMTIENPNAAKVFIEVGPHSALQGPARQILKTLSPFSYKYISVLVRKQNSVRTTLQMVAELFNAGYMPNTQSVLSLEPSSSAKPSVLHDLPKYSWDHSTTYWHESRLSKSHRLRKFPYHDLIGLLDVVGDAQNPRWRYHVGTDPLPWLQDHVVDGFVILPGSSYLCMAIESMSQFVQIQGNNAESIKRFTLRNVTFSQSLVIPGARPDGDSQDVELQVSLTADITSKSKSDWRHFRVTSYNAAEDSWLEHCTGSIRAQLEHNTSAEFDFDTEREASALDTSLVDHLGRTKEIATTKIDAKELYDELAASGNVFGPTFRAVTSMSLGRHSAYATVKIPDIARAMPAKFMRPHTVHPATMDAINHVAAVLFKKQCRNSPVMPTFIGELSISTEISSIPGDDLLIAASMKPHGIRQVSGDTFVYQETDGSIRPVISIHKWELMAIGEAQDEHELLPFQRRMTYRMDWQKDVEYLKDTSFSQQIEAADIFGVGYEQGFNASQAIQLNDKAAAIFLRDALQKIGGQRCSAPHFDKFLDWAKRFCTEENLGTILGELDDEQEQNLIRQSSSLTGAQGELLHQIGTNLLDILTGQKEALSLMLHENLLSRFYTEAFCKSSYLQMAEYVKILSFKHPRLKILEIGAGTGAATIHMLHALDNTTDGLLLDRYCYTDISMGFMEQARDRFRPWENHMDYRALDISKDPLDQPGFADLAGTFDLVLASNVIHATPSLGDSLSNARKLLRADGRLILIEVTRFTSTVNTIFGTLPGWWMSEDGREDSPLLSVSGWDSCLRSHGFSGVDIATPDHRGDTALTNMIVSKAVETPHVNGLNRETRVVSIIVGSQNPTMDALSGAVAQSLEQEFGIKSKISNLSGFKTEPDSRIVVLDMAEAALLKDPSPTDFGVLQKLVTNPSNVFWVSFRATAIPEVKAMQGMIRGFARTACRENDALNLATLDLDEPLSPSPKCIDPVSNIITRLILSCFWGTEKEKEFSVSNGQVLVPRLRSDARFNEWVDSTRSNGTVSQQPYHTAHRPLKLEAETPGLLNSLRFVDDPVPRAPLGPYEIQLESRAHGVNFKDVFVAMGQMTPDVVMVGETAGVVTAVGENMHRIYKVGDRVACMHAEPFASHPRVNGYHAHVLPQGMSWADGASVIAIFYTVWWCLDQVAKLSKGQTILIHAGSGGVGQAAIQLAQHVGAEIFVTVGSLTKKQLVMSNYGIPDSHIFSTRSTTFKEGVLRLTHGKGVDVVLNSLSGELLDASWESVAPFGTFIEIGKADVYKRKTISMTPFDKCVSFVPVDLALMTKARVEQTHYHFREVFSCFERGIFKPVGPVRTFPIGDIAEAFRLIAQRKHVGKLVVVAEDDDTAVKATLAQSEQFSLQNQSTYVIVGGLGDLGKRIGRYLVSLGATHIVTLSRSIPDTDILEPWLDEIKQMGGQVHTVRCDVTDIVSTRQAADTCVSLGLPPVKGVIYGGMVLSDHALENMTLEQYNTATKPKVHGTLNVHEAFSSFELDFFILLSSTAGILGVAGQANYAAGNTFQDAFALAQNAREGCKTRYISLDLGAIEGTGAINRLSAKSKDVWNKSTIVMSFEEVYKSLAYAMSPHATEDGFEHCVLGFDRETVALDLHTSTNPMFALLPTSTIRYGDEDDTKDVKDDQALDPTRVLQNAKTLAECEAIILTLIAEKFSVFLDNDIPTDIPIAQLALDSLVSIELKNWMVRTFQASLQASELAGALSLEALAKLLASRSRCISDEVRGRPAEEGSKENSQSPRANGTNEQSNDRANGKVDSEMEMVPAAHGWECCKNSKILPKYPLVDLDDALDYFLDNTGHFCTGEELRVLNEAVDELRQPNGPARQAYAKLVDLYNDPSLDSWMYDLISDSVFLKRPHPVAPFSNVMGTHFESQLPHTQVERAAVITLAASQFQKMVVANDVEPLWYFGMASCTWQWRWFFNACREPGLDGDTMRIYPDQSYIMVLRRGRAFKVSLQEATYESLKATYAAIIRHVENEGYWTGMLTTDWRPSWAKFRTRALEISASNVEYIKAIDQATFLVCLDDGSPETDEEHVRQAYLRDGFNRWMDKCTQFMIAENGKSGFIMEHGAIDGITAIRACDFIHDAIQSHVRDSTKTNGTGDEKSTKVNLQEYHFQSDPELEAQIVKLREQYAKSGEAIGVKNHQITAFGTDHLMSHAVPVKSALDATVQLAIRLHYGYNTPCWEAVSMAHYHKGRPEIMQVATPDVVKFCDLALDESVSPKEKRAALFQLGRSMSGNMQKALTGQTHLRLLDLLKVCWPEDAPTAKLFQGDIFWRNPFVIANHAPSGNKVNNTVYGVQEPNSMWCMITPANDSIRVVVAGAAGEKTQAFAARLDVAAEIIKKIVDA